MNHYDAFLFKKPHLHPDSFVAGGAQLTGDVTLMKDSSIWYNCVLRADLAEIVIGEQSNVQDGSILHVDRSRGCIVGKRVTIGHHVNLHACTIGDECLIGIGAIVLSGAVIGRGVIVAAGSVVKENAVFPDFTLWAGVPARCVRNLAPESIEKRIAHALHYVELSKSYKQIC